MALNFNLASLRGSVAPLSHTNPHYPQQLPAYVELAEDGEITAGWSGGIGNGVPMDVWNGRTLRMSVPHNVNGPDLADYLEGEGIGLLEAIHAGHSVRWDGSNHVGRLTDAAHVAKEKLEEALLAFDSTVQIWTAHEYLFNANTLRGLWLGRSLDDVVDELELEAEGFDGVIEGDLRDALLDAAERAFDAIGDDGLDEYHIASLLEDGRITQAQADQRDDGRWWGIKHTPPPPPPSPARPRPAATSSSSSTPPRRHL